MAGRGSRRRLEQDPRIAAVWGVAAVGRRGDAKVTEEGREKTLQHFVVGLQLSVCN